MSSSAVPFANQSIPRTSLNLLLFLTAITLPSEFVISAASERICAAHSSQRFGSSTRRGNMTELDTDGSSLRQTGNAHLLEPQTRLHPAPGAQSETTDLKG